MRILIIGPYFEGSTTKMRGNALQVILKPTYFKAIDVEIPQKKMNPIFNSLGWRLKIGPMVTAINIFIKKELNKEDIFDFVWIEKGVFIQYETLKIIKKLSKTLIHYTPDTAFFHNKSRFFRKSIGLYDATFTTKSFELDLYKKYGAKEVFFVTQGYDNNIHKPYYKFEEKKDVVFIGQYHKSRSDVIQHLIDHKIKVRLVGVDWEGFAKRNNSNNFFEYLGKEILAKDYAKMISSGRYSIGLLSKIFPEKHTTRTFEIPACGTALISESNIEIDSYFEKDIDFISFNSKEEMVVKIKYYENNVEQLEKLTNNSYQKILKSKLSHIDIVKSIVEKVKINFEY